MAEKIFEVQANLQPYIDELRRTAEASNRFEKSSIKVIAALKRTDEGFTKLTLNLKATTKTGDKVAITNTKIAESEKKLKNAITKTTEALKVRSRLEKTRAKERVQIAHDLKVLAIRRKNEAESQRFAIQQARDLRQFQEKQGAIKISQRRFDRNKILAHSRALKENAEWEKRRQRVIQQGVNTLKRQTQAQTQATSATRRNTATIRTAQNGLKKQSELIHDLNVSWRSFFRLIALRIAAGSFLRLTSLIKESTVEAIEFSRKIAEIQTIIRESEQTLEAQAKITQKVIEVSAKHNFELADTTEAFYDALSNQVSDSLRGIEIFTNTAIGLSKATVSSLEDSSNAIVSVIQAFNLSFTEAESVAASLFNLVDRGRLRLNEIAETLGNVAVPAAALGIEFNELAAALANLTLQGISVHRSQTLLRNLFLKLQSPTETLKNTYKEWGFETGKQAQEALGFINILIKLDEIEQKSAGF
ncbi:MAG: phage tail tape measure protein, partial [Nitrosopumilus sp.]